MSDNKEYKPGPFMASLVMLLMIAGLVVRPLTTDPDPVGASTEELIEYYTNYVESTYALVEDCQPKLESLQKTTELTFLQRQSLNTAYTFWEHVADASDKGTKFNRGDKLIFEDVTCDTMGFVVMNAYAKIEQLTSVSNLK